MELKNKFFNLCIPARLSLSLLIYNTSDANMHKWVMPAGIAATGMSYRYATYDDDQTGGFGQNVWWNDYRVFHIIMALIFIILVSQKKYHLAKYIPLIDAIYGGIFVSEHYRQLAA